MSGRTRRRHGGTAERDLEAPLTARPWLKHYDEGVPDTLRPYPERTLLDYLHEAAVEGPDRTALWFLKGARVSNARLEKESDAFAAALAALGITKGDRVALLMPNCPQFLVAQLGAWKAGAVLAPLSVLYTDRELIEALDRSRPEAIVVLNRFHGRVRRILPSTSLRHVITTGITDYLPPLFRMLYTLAWEWKDGERIRLGSGDLRFLSLLARYRDATPPVVRVRPDDPAILLMSGGTTGQPKAVAGSHRALVISGIQHRAWLSPIVSEWEAAYMLPVPLYHSFGQAAVLNQALIGHNPLILVPDSRDIRGLLGMIERYGPWLFIGVPALYSAMLGHPKVRAGRVDLSSLRGCFSGAAPLPKETRRRFEEATGSVIVEGYSLSESMLAATVNPLRGPNKIGSVGMPLPDVEVRIVDPERPAIEVQAGGVGEILMTAPQLMIGYWNDPQATAETIRPGADGRRWLHTGDLGRMDEDGYLYVVDRKKDLIKVNGLQVWPREIEEVIAEHPAVAEAGVAGIPHESKSEVPKAWVVLEAGAHVAEEEIRAHCRERLAPFQVPAQVECCTGLPRNALGEVLRRELRGRARAERLGALPGG